MMVGNKITGVNLRKAGRSRRINDVYEVSIGQNHPETLAKTE